MGLECVSRTDVGLRRKINEDALLVATRCGLWAVADGMGGHAAGEVASAMVKDALSKLQPTEDLGKFIEQAKAAINGVNLSLIELGRSDAGGRTIGSTVVGLAIRKRKYCCFWAGDSRAYRFREGHIAQISRDHSLVQDLVAAGMLDADEALHHPQANVITLAVGVNENLKLDIVEGDVCPGDIFLLASDGLTNVVADAELAAELSTWAINSAADRMIATVLSRGAPDNVSLVIVSIT